MLLPWERRRAWLGGLGAARRGKALLLLIALGAVTISVWRLADGRARTLATRTTIGEVQHAVAVFSAEMGRCPRSVSELLHPPRSGAAYLQEPPVDGWGRPLWVRCPGREGSMEADVISAGPSGSFFLDDNVM